jgi:ribosome-binding protein aMBF1 (putative translation factor)
MDHDLEEDLRQAIRDSGLSITELSKRADITVIHLSRFTRGLRTLRLPTASKLARVLNLRLLKE